MPACPICAAEATEKFEASPYYICPNCDVWFQSPPPPKLWHAEHEDDPAAMSDYDKGANEQLAAWLFESVMQSKPGATLDVGAAYPYLASRLVARNCHGHAIDGAEALGGLPQVNYAAIDFESDHDGPISFWPQHYALITFVHSFEHLYDPVAAIRKLRSYVAEDGAAFIRMPDHRVPGYERDLTPGHYSIHPFYHTLTSILQLLVVTRDTFELVEQRPLQPGQRDMVLRPIRRAPTIALGMIVKNEERDLPRCLHSAEPAIDAAQIVDTGSTDRTHEVAVSTIDRPVAVVRYLKASDEQGRLVDFSLARNRYVTAIDTAPADWLFWMDADDELMTPDAIRRASYLTQFDAFDVHIRDGNLDWYQCRMWKTGRGIHFEGAVHEYAVLGDAKRFSLDESLVIHRGAPAEGQEDANARNLRILQTEYQKKPTPRGAFYLGNTHKDGGRYAQAVPWYQARRDFGEGFRDEYLFAILYGARCKRWSGDVDGAEDWARDGTDLAPTWAEFWYELACCAYDRKDYPEAITRCLAVPKGPPYPGTPLFRETSKYRDEPLRLISWAHEQLGNYSQAIVFAEGARALIGAEDLDWDKRIARLKAKVAPVEFPASGPMENAIALCRPGAIGDILMTLNLIPALREANPGKQIHYFCARSLGEQLAGIIHAAGVDAILDAASWGNWAPRYARAIALTGYPVAEGYPEKPMRRHLLQYFSAELGLPIISGQRYLDAEKTKLSEPTPILPALTLRRPARPQIGDGNVDDYATLQTKAGWSKYKQWAKWHELRSILRSDIVLIPIDETQGYSLAQAIALVANARIHVGIDSFANHLTNYFWESNGSGRRVPGVILWGSTQASAAGYAHNTNLSLGLPCQPCFREDPAISRCPRGPCINPPRASYADDTPWACTDGISVERVVEAVRELWEKTR